jgi:hypothetical protein
MTDVEHTGEADMSDQEIEIVINEAVLRLIPFLNTDWRSQASLCHLRPILRHLFEAGQKSSITSKS